MLVYYINPRGVLHVANYVIYGRETGQMPSDIPFAVYEACKDALEDATYREGYLQSKLGWSLGEIAFTYGELRWFAEPALRKIARGLGIDEAKRDTKKQLVEDIKRILRDVVTS